MLLALLAAAAEEEEPRIHIPHTDELIWGSLAFLLIFAFLAKFAFPKVKDMLEQRTGKIKGDLESAERTRGEADQVLERYKEQLAEARTEANKIIEEAKRTAEAMRRDLEARAQQEASEIVARARADVGRERDRALQELRVAVGDLSITLATKVIERELSNVEAHRSMVQKVIEELATAGNGNGKRS